MVVGTRVLICTAAAAVALAACDESKLQPQKPVESAKPAASAAAPTAATENLPPLPKPDPLPPAPAVLGAVKVPSDNAQSAQKVLLGKQLFFDKRLSKDGNFSCETCHLPEKGWTDGKPVSTKDDGKANSRHSPTLFNVAYNEHWYWDGRSPTLEKQIEAAWKSQLGADPAAVAEKIKQIPGYTVQFRAVFNHDATPEAIVQSLASFVRTLTSADSPWDKYEAGDKKAVGEDAVRGFDLFRNKAGCAQCHAPPLYTDNAFHDVGIGYDKPEPDPGRGKITKNEKENGEFKTPTLRSVTTHAPFFHDGRAATVEDAVDYMLSGGIKDKNPNLDPKMKKVTLSKKERADLLAFVKSLEAPSKPFETPKLPQ